MNIFFQVNLSLSPVFLRFFVFYTLYDFFVEIFPEIYSESSYDGPFGIGILFAHDKPFVFKKIIP